MKAMPKAGKVAETPDPVSFHVNTHCTTAQLCNYDSQGKAHTKYIPTIAAFMKSFSFTKESVWFLPRKMSK